MIESMGDDHQQDIDDGIIKNRTESSQSFPANRPRTDDQQAAENNLPLDQSFEVISPSSIAELGTMEEGQQQGDRSSIGIAETSKNDKPSSNSGSRKNSFQDRIKKSGSFLAKIQSINNDNDNVSNIQSSLASALSSFTSNFSLNSSSNNGNSANASSLTIETASTSTRLSQIGETREDIFIKKVALERKNLISLTKLIVKDLISSSLSVGRTLEDSHNATHLNNYCTLIDRVLKHGLKQNLLSNKSASLWAALDSLPKYLKESTLMSESIRSLANTKTSEGKIKAWMRLAMMQKKLPEYFNELLANKNVLLKDIYHDYAFMLNDEAHVFAGLIIGVNVIDCNFFVKDANFDMMDDIIDLSPYLRSANSYDTDQEPADTEENGLPADPDNIRAILDQKNYLEEWNRKLVSTISDLQSKIKNLEDHTSKLEMEAKLSEARISKLQAKGGADAGSEQRQENPLPSSYITDAIKNLIGNSGPNSKELLESVSSLIAEKPAAIVESIAVREKTTAEVGFVPNKSDEQEDLLRESSKIEGQNSKIQTKSVALDSSSLQQVSTSDYSLLRRQLDDCEKELAAFKERASILEASYRSALEKIKTLERDLDVHTSMNADKETTIKIYEKDIKDKQAQVESIRVSLNDSKKLNSDLSERLNDTSAKLKDRIKSVSTLQSALDKWKLENKTLATRLHDKQAALKTVSDELEALKISMDQLKKNNDRIGDELRKERESGQNSSVTVETQTAKIAELTSKLAKLEAEVEETRRFKKEKRQLEKRCQDYELSLEEVGAQLRQSRLELDDLKENSAVFLDSQWMDSKQVKNCALCQQSFSVTRRKHHCRLCGNVFCQTCSDNKMELASSAKAVRVCDTCHAFLLAKFVKSST